MLDAGSFASGLVTGLREGVEASLIVSIVLAYLARTGHRRAFSGVWVGVWSAIGVSLLAGIVVFVAFGDLPSPWEQVFEGATMLVAAGIVTWMLFWMRRQSAALKGQLQHRIDRALSDGRSWGLAVLAFTAIIREGLETSLFLVGQAAAASRVATDGSLSVLVGAFVGLVIAATIGAGIYRGSHRVDLRKFFRWTGIALIFIAAGLLSRAIHEFVEIGAITVGVRHVFDLGGVLPDGSGLGAFLRAIAGYSSAPEALTLAVYVTYLTAVLLLYLRPVRPVAAARPADAASA